MSSPNHPTSNIEDAFSSNFPDYIPASPDYVPASPGNTYSSSSNNSFGLVLIASPTLSVFHDDLYMNVMHAYYAKESPILPPTIMPPSSMLSLMFNPQEFFLPKELLPLKKRGYDRSPSSTSALPQTFEIGESSRKTSLERHREQIEEILNHLDELSLDRIEHIEDKIEGLEKVSTANSTVSTDSTLYSVANLSDATVYAFLATQPNGSKLVHEDLEQIHEDDLEEMDLKWQSALLSMRARKGPRNQDSRARNQDNSKRTVNVEDISSKAMVAIDGVGFDWSYMADEEVPTNLALMDFSDSEVHNTCSNTYLKSFETLKTQLDNLRVEFNKSEFNLATYKRGLASVEEQLFFYKKNEIEKFKKEKESNQIKIDNFENASKSLDKLIGSQISYDNRKGVGYNAVPPPPTGLFAPPTIDLSNSGLKEFQQPEFKGYGFKANKGVYENSSNEVKKSLDAPIIKDWVYDCDEDESEVRILKSDNV
ncbi:hypothetical protein Tco_0745297 [Tanacetum coccineum]